MVNYSDETDVEDTIVFLTREVFISANFSIASYFQKLRRKSVKNKIIDIYNTYLIKQSF